MTIIIMNSFNYLFIHLVGLQNIVGNSHSSLYSDRFDFKT